MGLQAAGYQELKARGLSAQPALHVIRKVADAYTSRAANMKAGNYGRKDSERYRRIAHTPVRFRPTAAQAYDDRCLSCQYDARTVSILTSAGRIRGVPFVCSQQALKTLDEHRRGESRLVHRDGAWFLIAYCEIPVKPLNTEPEGFLGVDLGIANIATTSDAGEHFTGKELNKYRRRQVRIRAELQARAPSLPSVC